MAPSTSLVVRNVQEAYVRGLQLVWEYGQREETRNGPALVVPWPVLTTYERPMERVLMDPARDANPFFHLLESIWMLAGRRDVASLEPFNAGLKRYSDDGVSYHGAYGYRWRGHFLADTACDAGLARLDQLARVIEVLRRNPSDRRVVLAMWDPEEDLGKDGLDFPCNTHVYFRVRHENAVVTGYQQSVIGRHGEMIDATLVGGARLETRYLDITICCRSNDAIWGAYGANAVHFSVLQEFVAAMCGFRVGRMHQLSNNLHAYEDVLERVGKPTLMHGISEYERRLASLGTVVRTRATPLFESITASRMDVVEALRCIEDLWEGRAEFSTTTRLMTGEGLRTIVGVREAYLAFKNRERDRALGLARDIPGDDWRRACTEWLERRRTASDERATAPG